MRIFDLKNNNLIVEPEVLTVPEFATLWNRDKGKNKDSAYRDFGYVYHMCDFNSPYSGYPQDKKEETIKQDIYKDVKHKIDKDVQAACKKYHDLTSTPKKRFVLAARNKLDEITKFLIEVPVTVDSMDTIQKIYKDLSNTIKNFDSLEEAVNKEQERATSRLKGDKKAAMFEE